MTLTQMKYFYTVCKYENYTKAAEELFVSQPAISQAMKELELECGIPLFCRHGNSLSLTECGRLLRDEVKIVLNQMEHIDHVIHDFSLQRNYLRVGLSTFSGNRVFPTIRHQFHLEYPQFEVISHEDITNVLFEWLDSDMVDLIITSPNRCSQHSSEHTYQFYALPTAGLQFCVHQDHPLAARSHVTVEDIANEPLVMLSDYYTPTKNVKQMFSDRGLKPNVIHYTSQMFTVERFIEQGAASGFLPAEVAAHNSTIVGIDFEKNQTRSKVFLIWKKHSLQYEAVRQFIALAKRLYPVENNRK